MNQLTLLKDIIESHTQDYQLVFAKINSNQHLESELKFKNLTVYWQYERFYLIKKTAEPLIWCQWSCSEFQILQAASIKELAQQIKKLPRWWSNFTFDFHRRQSLIAESLFRQYNNKRINFPQDHEKFHMQRLGGFWTLLETGTLLIASEASSWRYLGDMEFEENKEEPPSRAYLKLWEILTYLPILPGKEDIVLDLGSSPGGWSWVLANFAKEVVSIDKAPLAPSIAKNAKIKYLKESIFSLDPKKWNHVSWIFCDVICYPDKILQLITHWVNSGYKGNMIFTIKFQGETDFKVIEELKKIDHSKLLHLYHNKHELTWMRLQKLG